MSHIKVAQIITVSSSLKGLMLNQMQSLQQVGYEIVGISSPGPEIPAVEAAGIRHIPLPMARDIAPLADLKALWQLYTLMRREKFTIVHTHLAKPGLLGQLAARMAGVPVVINTIHGFHFHDQMSPWKRRFFIQLEKIAAGCSDLILSQNKEDLETALKEGVCPPEKIEHLGNGIDLTRFNPDHVSETARQQKQAELGLPHDALVIGFVGRLAAKRKGFLDFLQAGQRVIERCPQVHLLILGETDYGKPDAVHPTVAKDFGIDSHCHFLGFRPNEELPLWYSLMNLLVLPSPYEGIPRAVMEASAMGVPAVVTDVRGNREAVEPGRNGLLVPLGNVPALAEAIVELLTDHDRAQQMGQAGRRMAIANFDERRIFEKIQIAYAHLLSQKEVLTRLI